MLTYFHWNIIEKLYRPVIISNKLINFCRLMKGSLSQMSVCILLHLRRKSRGGVRHEDSELRDWPPNLEGASLLMIMEKECSTVTRMFCSVSFLY